MKATVDHRARKHVIIANAVPAVREVFDITGFSDILNLA